MPGVADNGGRQLNLFLFEVVRRTVDEVSGVARLSVIAVHPLMTAPSSVRYSDTSRTAVEKVHGGALVTRGGRGHQRVTVTGEWGVETRGFGPFAGTGPARAAKFRREVVRLPEAVTAAEVDAELGADLTIQRSNPVNAAALVDGQIVSLNDTPSLRAALLPGAPSVAETATRVSFDSPLLAGKLTDYDPARESLLVNWYDFWNDVAFEAQIASYEHTGDAKRGATSGNRTYVIQLTEVGPPQRPAGLDSPLPELFSGLGAWRDLNQAIRGYTGTALAQSMSSLTATALGTVTDLVTSLQAQVDGVEDIASNRATESTFATRWFQQVEQLRDAADGLAWTQALQFFGFEPQTPGEVRWREDAVRALDAGDADEELDELRRFAEGQRAAGGLVGMGSEEWTSYLTSGGAAGQRDARTAGTTSHRVRLTDTAETIETTYGVRWGDVLAVNGYTPDEALRPGVVLAIPRRRGSAVGPLNLPVLGSHVGEGAWGSDLAMELTVNADGDLATVSGTDALEQGAAVLFEEFGEALELGLDQVPEAAHAPLLRRRVVSMLLQDPRFVAVPQVDIEQTPSGLAVGVTIQAVNGGTVRAGAG